MPRHRTVIPWTPSKTREAVRLQKQGVKLIEIGQRLGGFSESTVRWRLKAADNPDAVTKRRARDRERMKNRHGNSPVRTTRIPDDVVADREARLTAPRSLTAAMLGDPPRGFSALDRRTARDLERLL